MLHKKLNINLVGMMDLPWHCTMAVIESKVAPTSKGQLCVFISAGSKGLLQSV